MHLTISTRKKNLGQILFAICNQDFPQNESVNKLLNMKIRAFLKLSIFPHVLKETNKTVYIQKP